jgi:CubicO group peptidase (beta-lactamase class C family)
MRSRYSIHLLALLTLLGPGWAEARKPRDPFRKVDRLMQRGARQRTFQSAVLLVSYKGKPLFHKAYGKASKDTVFDLASLTKPLATTTCLMRLVDDDRIKTTTQLRQVIPSLSDKPIGRAPLWQLLSHSAGLPARNTLTDQVRGLAPARARAKAKRLAADYPLAYDPGSKALYSDLSFILAGWAAERAGGARLDRLVDKLVVRPLGLKQTGFINNGAWRRAERANGRPWRVAPTERVSGEGRLKGQVHDEKARAMGGVSGCAGLFASAADVQRIVGSLTDAYHGRPSIFSPQVVHQFFDARRVHGSMRALGWDRPKKRGAGGKLFSEKHSVGHLGYTGTSVWVDLKRELSVVLLTNRVYYGRDPQKIQAFRPQIHDAIDHAVARLSKIGAELK